MTPKEAYWEIKAQKAREDRHYRQMAVFVAALYNVSGPKKAIKPEQLYQPNFPKKKRREETPEERRTRQRDLKKHVESLLARHGRPPVEPPKD